MIGVEEGLIAHGIHGGRRIDAPLEVRIGLRRTGGEATALGDLPFNEVRSARATHAAFLAALENPEAAIAKIEAADVGPAAEAFIEWAGLGDVTLEKKVLRKLKALVKGRATSHWKRAVKAAERAAKAGSSVEELTAELAGLEGELVREFERHLEEFGADGIATVNQVPSRWLVRAFVLVGE